MMPVKEPTLSGKEVSQPVLNASLCSLSEVPNTEAPSSLAYSLSSLSKEELRYENDKLTQEIEVLRLEIQRRRRELRMSADRQKGMMAA